MQYFAKRQPISRRSPSFIMKQFILFVIALIIYDSHAVKNVRLRLPSWRKKEVKESTDPFIAEIDYGRGDVLKLSFTGELLFATTRTSLIYIKPQISSILCNACSWCSGFANVYEIKNPSDFTRKTRAVLMYKASENWTPQFEKGINLGILISGKVVPYDMKNCNAVHYMNYLTKGSIQKAKGCYLARDLTKITALALKDKGFYLKDPNNNKIQPYYAKAVIGTLIPSGQVDSIGDKIEYSSGPPPATEPVTADHSKSTADSALANGEG